MSAKLDKLTVMGFKSIRELKDFEMRNLNVLIGGNGSGKSNFVEIFRILEEINKKNLDSYALENGGADGFFYNGPKYTSSIDIEFTVNIFSYYFELKPTASEKFLIKNDRKLIADKLKEASLRKVGWGYDGTVFHFHDTSNLAPMRRSEIIEDKKSLRRNASNIAPLLLSLRNEDKYKDHYNQIVSAIRLVAPFFEDFRLEVTQMGSSERVKLDWLQKGSDYPMQPYHLSDGTMRFICLATALLQPCLPAGIIIDEPELGLHPYAIEILAELIKTTAQKTQIIISTQSSTLVDCFSPEDIIVVNRKNGASTFERLNPDDFKFWLEDYSVGDLWRKNIITGGPSND